MPNEPKNMHLKRELTISYQTQKITFLATPFDDVAYWIKIVSLSDMAHLPKHIFLHKTSHGWRSSCGEKELMNELVSVIERIYHGKKAYH
jgi:hypothetical protein